MVRMRHLPIVIPYIIFLALLGCSKPNAVKQDWLNHTPCAPPCWSNIEPGVTTGDQVDEMLKQNSLVDANSITTGKVGSILTGISWSFLEGGWEGRTGYMTEDPEKKLTYLHLDTPDLCLKEIISAYGEPSSLNLPVYQKTGRVDLIWEKDSFIYITDLNGPGEEIKPDTCGGMIVQVAKGTMPADITVGPPADSDLVPWHGYGKY